MAETARDRQARLERKLRGMEAEIASLRAKYDGLLAERRDWGERSVEDAWWFPLATAFGIFTFVFVLAKYF